MKLKDYIKQLQDIAKKHPELDVITSKDDEGNGYQHVYYSPCVGKFDGNYDFDNSEDAQKKPNAVCLN